MVAVGWGAVGDLAGPAALQERITRLEDENAALREEQQLLEDEQQRLEAERERLRGENERLRAEGERLREANQRLRAEVEALRRASKRQAAPFSREDPSLIPGVPGASPARPTAGTRTASHPGGSTGWWRLGCRDAVLAAAASWSPSGSRPSMSRTSLSPAR
jgi:exonuclease VII large subunit